MGRHPPSYVKNRWLTACRMPGCAQISRLVMGKRERKGVSEAVRVRSTGGGRRKSSACVRPCCVSVMVGWRRRYG